MSTPNLCSKCCDELLTVLRYSIQGESVCKDCFYGYMTKSDEPPGLRFSYGQAPLEDLRDKHGRDSDIARGFERELAAYRERKNLTSPPEPPTESPRTPQSPPP